MDDIPTREELIALYSDLQSRVPPAVQQAAADSIRAIIHPNVIPMLFWIAEECEVLILKQYACYHIALCLTTLRDTLDVDFVGQCRAQALRLLIGTGDASLIEAIFKVIDTLIGDKADDWPDLIQLAVDFPQTNLYLVVKIFQCLIRRMNTRTIIENLPYLVNVITKGLQSDDFGWARETLFLFKQIGQAVAIGAAGAELARPLLALFLRVLGSDNARRFSQISYLLFMSYQGLNSTLFPFPEALPHMVDTLGNTALKFDFRLQVHEFLASSFMLVGSCVPLSADQLETLFQLEQQICCEYFGPGYAPEERDHPFETELMLAILFQRIPVTELPEYTFMHVPADSHTIGESCFTLLVFEAGLMVAPSAFEGHFRELFSFFMEGLQHQSVELQKTSAKALNVVAETLWVEIEEHIKPLLRVVFHFIESVCEGDGVALLIAIVQHLPNTDPIFDDMLDRVLRTFSGSPVFAAQVLAPLIANSRYQAILLWDHLWKLFTDLLPTDAVFFSCMEALVQRSPSAALEKLPELMPMLISGIEQPFAVSCLGAVVDSVPGVEPFFDDIFQGLLGLVESGDCDQAACDAAELMGKVVAACPGTEASDVLLRLLLHLAECGPMGLSASLATFERVCTLVPSDDERLGQFADLALAVLGDVEDVVSPRSTLALRVLTSLLRAHGVEAVGALDMLSFVFGAVNFLLESNHPEVPLAEFVRLISVLLETSPDVTGTVVVTRLLPLFKCSSPRCVAFAIQTLAQCLSIDVATFRVPQVHDLLAGWRVFLFSGVSDVVAAAAQFVVDVTTKESCCPHISPYADMLVKVLHERLTREAASKTVTRDQLAAALAALGGNVIGDRFPFAQCVLLILEALPLVRRFDAYGVILTFLTSVARALDPDVRRTLTKTMLEFIARPVGDIVKLGIDGLVIRMVMNFVVAEIAEEDFLGTALEMLGGDDVKLAFLQDAFENLPNELPMSRTDGRVDRRSL
jgi:hypothetical protein